MLKVAAIIIGSIWLGAGGAAHAQDVPSFEIILTFSAGSCDQSSGSGFVLEGALGRVELGIASGGPFELEGGFWVVEVESPCVADCDGNSVVDTLDLLCFTNRISSGEPDADCDGSGVIDVFDLLWFAEAFGRGCP